MSLFKRNRSSRTGQYVSQTEADANRDTTVTETAHLHHAMRWHAALLDIATLPVTNTVQAAATMRHTARQALGMDNER